MPTDGARSVIPGSLEPMKATTGEMPSTGAWSFEIKWDGVRALSYIDRAGSLRLESRNLADITPRYPELAPMVDQLRGHEVVLDGEVVAFGADGTPSFESLQSRMHLADRAEVARRMKTVPVAYVLFDVLWLDGGWRTGLPYEERRALLESLGLHGPNWQTPAAHDDGAALLTATASRGMEGVMAKRLGSTYEVGRRSRSWIKVKHVRRQEVVIGGWLPGSGNRSGRLGALIVGVHEDGRLRCSGRVGTGFTDAVLADLERRLVPLAREACPFDPAPRMPGARWVQPELVCEVAFTEWTRAGTLRHPSYKGLRDDKAPPAVVREDWR